MGWKMTGIGPPQKQLNPPARTAGKIGYSHLSKEERCYGNYIPVGEA
jgi:hypothetical protein